MLRFSLLAAALAAVMAAPASATIYAQAIDWDGSGQVGWDGDGVKNPLVRTDVDDALGPPDQTVDSDLNFLSLNLGGTAVFDFGQSFGQTATPLEVTFGCSVVGGVCSNHPEQVRVLAGINYNVDTFNLLGFTDYGTIGNGGGSVVIGGPFQFLAFVDESAALGPISTDGYDVDAVGVHPVSEPGSLVLAGGLALGFAGMMSWKRRRTEA